jgi:ferredoxin/flavodoxin
MKTVIFYFSSTGNSFALARALAGGLGDAALVPIPKVLGSCAPVSADRVGFVFPVVAWGLPRIVAEFLKGLKLEGAPYVFAAATCGGTPGAALRELRGLLCKTGSDLHAGFVCREGANAVSDDPGFVKAIRRMNRTVHPTGRERLPEMLAAVRERRGRKPETSSFSVNAIGGMMHAMMSMAGDKLKMADSGYRTDGNCARCRTCERICPRANVTVGETGPVWHHNCEMCNACIQWCPRQAIHVANETRRYRNPDVRAEDLLLR